MNIYHQPEKYGLTIVGEVDLGASYEFYMFVVWKDDSGQLFYATDAGCSCPSPFENHGINDLTKATSHEVANALKDWDKEGYYGDDFQPSADVTSLIERLMAA